MIHRPASRGISGYPFMGKEHGLSPLLPLDLLQEKGCRHRAHAVTGLAEGGETGLKHGGVFYVVKANHGEIFWNAEPPFPGGLEGTKGQHVGDAEQSGGPVRQIQQASGGLNAGGEAVIPAGKFFVAGLVCNGQFL